MSGRKLLDPTTHVLRYMKNWLQIDTLKIIYFACVHTTISYGITFWENSSAAKNVFLLQNKIPRIITTKKTRDSSREIFKDFRIMNSYSQYIYSLILVVRNNKMLLNFNN